LSDNKEFNSDIKQFEIEVVLNRELRCTDIRHDLTMKRKNHKC